MHVGLKRFHSPHDQNFLTQEKDDWCVTVGKLVATLKAGSMTMVEEDGALEVFLLQSLR
jgi:hypothetical protein